MSMPVWPYADGGALEGAAADVPTPSGYHLLAHRYSGRLVADSANISI